MKTIYFIALQTANVANFPHVILPNTTLNEKFNIGKRTITSNPVVKYFSLGMKSGNEVDEDGVLVFKKDVHSAKHASVFKPIPFITVKLEMDLSRSERDKYRLRKTFEIDNEQYVSYYLKEIDDVNIGRYLNVTTNEDGDTIIDRYDSSDSTVLNPVNHIEPYEVTKESFKALAYTKPFRLPLTPQEAVSVIADSKRLYGEDQELKLGEVMICSGQDVIDQNLVTEANGVQASVFIDVDTDLEEIKEEGISFIYELGGMELNLIN